MKCKYCEAENLIGARFCAHCGQALNTDGEKDSTASATIQAKAVCQRCGKENKPDSKFCQYCGQTLSTDFPENSTATPTASACDSESSDDVAPAVVQFLKGLNSDDRESVRNDTVCPFCGEPGCQFTQRNTASVTSKHYHWIKACCGMLLLGPFGLLCGLCGTGSNTDLKSELWWVCHKCGKQHISVSEAIKKWEVVCDRMWSATLTASLLFIIAKWYLEWGLIAFLVALFPTLWLYESHNEISEDLGDPLIRFLPSEQKKSSFGSLILCTILVVAVGQFGFPALMLVLGD